ncbi:hypothetical protein B0H11DRAFT_1107902 [Mycena galericulata]|nr:hypothetical protein B0H11DRAFT_1107902 [Mycena galericulata]
MPCGAKCYASGTRTAILTQSSKQRLAAMEKELESKNVALQTELRNSRADAETRKKCLHTIGSRGWWFFSFSLTIFIFRDSLWQLARQKETIVAQNTLVNQLQSTLAERDEQLVSTSYELRIELNKVKDQLKVQQTAFAELQQTNNEQRAQEKLLRDEIALLKTRAKPTSQTHKRPKSVRKIISKSTPVARVSERLREPASPPSAFGRTVSSAADAVPDPEPEASTSRGPCSDPADIKHEFQVHDHVFVDPGPLLTLIPASRREGLQKFPDFVPDIEGSAIFTRAFLSAHLGGNSQALIVKIGEKTQKPLAKECNVLKFLCPNLAYNPWCPRAAGQHGFMFVGLGTEMETFLIPEILNLFLSVPPTKGSSLEVSYLGQYEVCRVSPLTVAEWQTLSPAVQHGYAGMTASRDVGTNKARKDKHKANIRAEYDAGMLSVPCVQLKCIGFDEKLYVRLVQHTTPSKRESDELSWSPEAKRRRLD